MRMLMGIVVYLVVAVATLRMCAAGGKDKFKDTI